MMLTKRQIEKYADVLLWPLRTARKNRFKKNEIILIRFDLSAIKLAEVLQGKILDMGMNPVFRSGMTPIMEHDFFEKANSMQLKFLAPGERELFENLNGSI